MALLAWHTGTSSRARNIVPRLMSQACQSRGLALVGGPEGRVSFQVAVP